MDLSVTIAGGSDWSDLWQSLIGALVGGFFALLAVMVAAHFSKKQAREDRRAVVVGGVRALWQEMTVNFNRYEQILGPVIRGIGPDEVLTVNWPVHSDYFSVYAANAGLLGELEDDALAGEIIEIVAAAKGMIDSLRLNVTMIEELNEIQNQAVDRGRAHQVAAAMRVKSRLVEYALGLKALDIRITEGMAKISPRVAALK